MNDAELMELLHERFFDHGWAEVNDWAEIKAQLADVDLSAIHWMEESGGEPAIAPWWEPSAPVIVCDCSQESPVGRRSLCYDRDAWEKRKKVRPEGDAVSLAESHGARLMTEDEYLQLQEHGVFDTRSSSWLLTESDLREQGGAIFGDRRFGRAFIYCNGADSYYGVRGFRVVVTL